MDDPRAGEADPELTSVLDRFASFVAEATAEGSPLYARISAGLARDSRSAGLLLEAPPDQRRPNLLFAAVHHLMLSGPAHRLGEYYPSIAGDAARPPGPDASAAFGEFCALHREALVALVRTRRTQTNEPRRAGVLYPALQVVAEEAGRPLAVGEIGASAGLLLRFDRYGYRYGDGPPAGAIASELQLDVELRGGLHPPAAGEPPPVVWRRGLDASPLDVGDPDAAAWLRALVWPEHEDRRLILDRALEIALTTPAPLVRGDAVDDLARLVVDVPPSDDAALCLFHFAVATYLPPRRRTALHLAVHDLSRRAGRPIWLLVGEWPNVIESLGLPVLAGLSDVGPGDAVVALIRCEPDGSRTERLLATAQAHGRWLRWRDRMTAAAVQDGKGDGGDPASR